jgi:hypothetical protein
VLPQATAEHYRAQQALIVATLALVRREWARMGPDFDVSWAALGRRILLLTTFAQLGAARSGAAYVPATLAELGTPVEPVGEVVPAAFAGVASDGRPLDSLLDESVIKAKVARGGGAPVNQALAVGGQALDMYVHTQVADAARGAASVAIAASPRTGLVRLERRLRTAPAGRLPAHPLRRGRRGERRHLAGGVVRRWPRPRPHHGTAGGSRRRRRPWAGRERDRAQVGDGDRQRWRAGRASDPGPHLPGGR